MILDGENQDSLLTKKVVTLVTLRVNITTYIFLSFCKGYIVPPEGDQRDAKLQKC